MPLLEKNGSILYPGSPTSVRLKVSLGQTFYSQRYQLNTTNGFHTLTCRSTVRTLIKTVKYFQVLRNQYRRTNMQITLETYPKRDDHKKCW